jgi:hypothetical protein
MKYVKLPGMKTFQFSCHRSASSPATGLHRYIRVYYVTVARRNIILLFVEMSVFEIWPQNSSPKLIMNFS